MGFNNVNVNVSGPVQPTSTYKTKVLKGNHSFASQVTEPNMKYVIKHDFDLGGESVTIPANCVLEFDGGSLSNGTLTGEVAIINQPKNFLSSIDCSNLEITTMSHLTDGDLNDTFDSYSNDDIIYQRCEQNVKALNKFYSIDGLEKIYIFSFGSSYRKQALIRLMFYDENFFYIERSSWNTKINGYDIPEGAVYVNVLLSFDCREIANIPTLTERVYANFLGNTFVPVSTDHIRDGKGNALEYYNVNVSETTRVFVSENKNTHNKYTQYGRDDDTHKSVCIPYSLLRQFDYLCVKANTGYFTRIHFLTKEPKVNGEEMEDFYSDYWQTNRKINADTEPVYLPITSDVRYIVIYCYYEGGGVVREAAPEYVRLYTREKLGLDTLSDTPPYVNSSARDVNKYSMHIMHWNIGNFSHGGNRTSISASDYEAKRASFLAFMNKYKDYHFFLNEYNTVFANNGDVAVATPSAIFPNRYSMKAFTRFNDTDQLACVYLDGLVGYRMYNIKSLKRRVSITDPVKHPNPTPLLPKPYTLYRYFIGNTSLYIVHTHLASYMGVDNFKIVLQELMDVVADVSNAIIIGDFNIDSLSNDVRTMLAGGGYSVANDLDVKPTHVSWNHSSETPVSPTEQSTLDWCIYKGSYTVSDFHVCTDAVDNGYEDGDIEHMLSDHWPIALTIERSNISVVPADTGNEKYDINEKRPLCFDGENWIGADFERADIRRSGASNQKPGTEAGTEQPNNIGFPYKDTENNSIVFWNGNGWFSPSDTITYKKLTDVRTFEPGIYRVTNGADMVLLNNIDDLPTTLTKGNYAFKTGFVMIVNKFADTGTVHALIIPNQQGIIFAGTKSTTSDKYDNWIRYVGRYDTKENIGSASKKPNIIKEWMIGTMYLDTDLAPNGKPLWWNGTYWVDAAGAICTCKITFTLSNIKVTNNGQPSIGIQYTTILSASEGYSLPATITVKINSTTLTAGTDYTYNQSTGEVVVLGIGGTGGVTGDLKITATGVANS